MAINNYAEHCTFIENQYVEKQVVEQMVVEQQSLKQPDPKPAGTSIDRLRLMLNDDDLYAEVVQRLHACEKAEQVKEWVCQLIKKKH